MSSPPAAGSPRKPRVHPGIWVSSLGYLVPVAVMGMQGAGGRTGANMTPQLRAFALSFLAAAVLLAGGGLFTRWRMYRARLADPHARPPAGRLAAGVNIVMGLGAFILFLVVPTEHHQTGLNESAAIGSLRALCSGQRQFHEAAIVDLDGDGTGEFGFLGELAGTDPVRGSGKTMTLSPFIAAVLGRRYASTPFAEKRGYLFAVYLPSATGGHLTSAPGTGSAPATPADADPQEQRWVAYAWPRDAGLTGNRAYFVNQEGTVYACANHDGAGTPLYDGPGAPPPATAIFTADSAGAPALDGTLGVHDAATERAGGARDGQQWYPAGD